MSRRLATVLLTAALVGCASAPQSPAQTVYLLEGELAGALAGAAAYHDLPACPGPVLCKDAGVMLHIQAASVAAWSSLHLAEDAVRAGKDPSKYVGVAQDAVNTLTTIVAATKVK